jgi:pimeloyl-ACP methyl ester carboxylesterase
VRLALDDPDLDGQLQRSVAKADYGMANVGECLWIASQVRAEDLDSWYWAFSEFARGLRERANAGAAAGHRVSARGTYLRACEYYRNAFFFLRSDLDDERLQSAYGSSRDCFRIAASLLNHPLEPIELPIGDARCGGYLALPAGDGPFPLVLAPGGYDSTAEELYPTVLAGVSRGYGVLAFDGPGQGGTLYEQRVPMRPDWEAVIPPVIDAAVERLPIDPDRIALLGRSFGGYLAPRAASAEPRLAALIVDPGQYDLGAAFKERLPKELLDRLDDESQEARDAFEALLDNEHGRRFFSPRMATHGAATVQQYVRTMLDYTNAGRAGSIRCPTLVCDNETDAVSTGQGQRLYDELQCPKDFVRFTAAEGAEGHCEGMAGIVFYDRAFDWLDSTFAERG